VILHTRRLRPSNVHLESTARDYFPLVTVTGEESSIGLEPLDPPLMAPLHRDLGWTQVQRMSQSAAHRDDPMLRRIRATAAVKRGTRMTKVLSAAQVAGHLGGWLPYGF